jgi:hypothetical protein
MTKYRETDLVKRLKPDSFFEELVAGSSPFASGTSREVFSVADDPAVVIKRTKNPYPGANMAEWFIWNAVRSTDLADVFTEVLSLSESGRFLMMLRLTPLTQADYADIPMLPVWLNDRKPNALGKLGAAVKVMDYGVLNYNCLLNTTVEKSALQVDAEFKRQRGLPGW